jgi:AraC family transcriptional regulator of adaptative response/methylated-DNA-[protein]-cysteine methyltransferase
MALWPKRSSMSVVGEPCFQSVAALRGAHLQYNLQTTEYGRICFVQHDEALVFLGFTNRAADVIEPLGALWPVRQCARNRDLVLDFGAPPPLHLHGTSYQHRVWRALCDLKTGQSTSYGDLAAQLQSGARAIGGAVGANPIAWFVPCHRVLRKSGALGGYRWGLAVKRRLLALENITTQ